jgi:hypothetical protein
MSRSRYLLPLERSADEGLRLVKRLLGRPRHPARETGAVGSDECIELDGVLLGERPQLGPVAHVPFSEKCW